MKSLTSGIFVAGAMILAVLTPLWASAQQTTSTRPAVPVNAITGILDAFKTHDIVALSEPHGNEQAAKFRLALIRDPRFATTVNDIVVESGESSYQDIMDRFIQGENVPDEVLRQAWQNTTGPGLIWDFPIYEEFFRAVRDLNASLPKDHKLRVLLGDPPIDWSKVKGPKDIPTVYGLRDTFPADLVQREVLAKRRHALVVYGSAHFERKIPDADLLKIKNGTLDDRIPPMANPVTMVQRLESAGASVFSINTDTYHDLAKVQPDIAAWPIPSLAIIRGTPLGLMPMSLVQSPPSGTPLTQGEFDADLYLGPPSVMTQSVVSPKLCADPAYIEMRVHRLAIFDGISETQHRTMMKTFCSQNQPRH